MFPNIFVSTDDEDIKQDAKSFNLDIIDRPGDLCTDAALFEDALVHGYKEILERLGRKPEIVVVLMCNVATISGSLIDKAVDALLNDADADSAVTVSKLNMYSPLRARRLDADGYLKPFVPFESFGDPEKLSCDRDSQGDVYFADMSHSVVRSHCLDKISDGMLPQKWMGQRILPIDNIYGCDIDHEWQVSVSEWWIKNKAEI